VADDGRGCNQVGGRGYGVVVTESTPEPTLADVMAAIKALATDVAVVKATQGEMRFSVAQSAADMSVLRDAHAKTNANVESVRRDIAQLRADGERHTEQIRADVAGVKTDTAFVEGYVNDMHEAVRRHIADPHAHPDAA
jgi:hypothetical protein